MADTTIPPEVLTAFGSMIFFDMPNMIRGEAGYKLDREAMRGEDEEKAQEDGEIPKIKLK
jgi:hypothetical protein